MSPIEPQSRRHLVWGLSAPFWVTALAAGSARIAAGETIRSRTAFANWRWVLRLLLGGIAGGVNYLVGGYGLPDQTRVGIDLVCALPDKPAVHPVHAPTNP